MTIRWIWIAAVVCGILMTGLPAGMSQTASAPSQVNVRTFGARGDGQTDDTAAFNTAMAAVAERGGTVFIPVGTYLIKTHLVVPPSVTLEGVWKIPTVYRPNQGSILLAVEGAGSETGPPFISLHTNSAIKGLTVFYPDQKPDHIVPYPWCVQSAGGDDISIVDCLLVNPYQAVDFGTHPSGRHYIRGLYGQPLRRGIYVDKTYDIGRIENVHFWTFWDWDEKSGIRDWMWKNGEAFIFARTDWEYVFDTFAFGYKIGYHFVQAPDGAMNGNLLGIGADASQVAVQVDASQTPGLLITNGEFVSFAGVNPTEVVVTAAHAGVVQFQNCSFWGPAHQIARIAGTGHVSFSNCNFVDWDSENKAVPAISLFGGSLLVNGCNFMKAAPQAILRDKAESAVFEGNRMGGPLGISNPAHADLQVGLNTYKKPPARPREEANAIVVDDSDGPPAVTFQGHWLLATGAGNYYRGAHWAMKGTGNARAIFRPAVRRTGRYRVSVYFGPDPGHDHASNAPVTIHYDGGSVTKRIDLRPLKGAWIPLGVYRLIRTSSIVLSNDANGNVLADAVKVVPAS